MRKNFYNLVFVIFFSKELFFMRFNVIYMFEIFILFVFLYKIFLGFKFLWVIFLW